MMKQNYSGLQRKKILLKNYIQFFSEIFILLLFFLDVGSSDMMLLRGETVVVIGHSTKIGHLVVERNNHTIHVPFQYLELKKLF